MHEVTKILKTYVHMYVRMSNQEFRKFTTANKYCKQDVKSFYMAVHTNVSTYIHIINFHYYNQVLQSLTSKIKK